MMGIGDHLSKPITEKISKDESDGKFSYGACSMQGWRTTQEDAHNCILDFDDNVSLFAVYDGHCGPEVAEYASQQFPQFLKNTEKFKSRNFEEALVEGFLSFDDAIVTPHVHKILEKLKNDFNDTKIKKAMEGNEENNGGENYSESGPSVAGSSKGDTEEDLDDPDLLRMEANKPIEEVLASYGESALNALASEPSVSRGKRNPILRFSGDGSSSNEKIESESSDGNIERKRPKRAILTSADSCEDATPGPSPKKTKLALDDLDDSSGVKEFITKSEIDEEDEDDSEDESFQPTDEALEEAKGSLSSQLLKRFIPSSDDDDEDDDDDDDDDDDEDDEIFSAEESTDDEDEDEEEEEEEDLTGSNEISEDAKNMEENKPGIHSGCTAVVALIHDDDLYVANAGDSRCVVCIGGKAVEMTLDHKPTNEHERKRIKKAGGTVKNRRVDGNLNLSRAFGDHLYKRNSELSNREQMITALPDIRKLKIEPDVEFIVLACDGIWDIMSNQEVVDFFRAKLNTADKLSKICEEMCDKVLSEYAVGPGTDNMTCIIVKPNRHIAKIEEDVDSKSNPCTTEVTKIEMNRETPSNGVENEAAITKRKVEEDLKFEKVIPEVVSS